MFIFQGVLYMHVYYTTCFQFSFGAIPPHPPFLSPRSGVLDEMEAAVAAVAAAGDGPRK